MKPLEAYRFHLPEENIAKFPLEPAHNSRLLRLPRRGPVEHHRCLDLPKLLPERSLIVANDTLVVKARLTGFRDSGGKIEALLYQPVQANVWLSLFRGKVKENEELTIAGERVRVAKVCGAGFVHLDFGNIPVGDLMDERGELPIPPYIDRQVNDKDDAGYQTSFAKHRGAVAAPTAGLHFTKELRSQLEEAGHEFVTLTLHVGPGTFLPVRVDDVLKHRVPSERAIVKAELWQKILQHKKRSRPVVAVGTTATRCLETLARRNPVGDFEGDVGLTISSPFKFRVVDRLCSNFHLPESSLLLLASAFSGRSRLLSAYEEAVKEGYRFYSYGDLTLLE